MPPRFKSRVGLLLLAGFFWVGGVFYISSNRTKKVPEQRNGADGSEV